MDVRFTAMSLGFDTQRLAAKLPQVGQKQHAHRDAKGGSQHGSHTKQPPTCGANTLNRLLSSIELRYIRYTWGEARVVSRPIALGETT